MFFKEEEFLDFVAVGVNLPISQKSNLCHFFEDFYLLGGDVVSIPTPNIIERQVILIVGALESSHVQQFFGFPGYMIKSQKAHIIYAAFPEEYSLRRQIRMNYIILMQNAQ